MPILQNYNITWLRVEYDAVVASARAAKLYQEALELKHIYPNLKYMPSVSATPRDTHRKFYGLVRPVDDPVWLSILPPSDWGCKCWFQQSDEEVTPLPSDFMPPKGPFANNPAVSGELFSQDHPYFQAKGINDPLVDKEIKKTFRKYTEKRFKSQPPFSVIHDDLTIKMSNNNLSEAFDKAYRQDTYWDILQILQSNKAIDDLVKSSSYVDTKLSKYDITDPKFNPILEHFKYYQVDISGKKHYLNLKKLKNDENYYLYCITEAIPK